MSFNFGNLSNVKPASTTSYLKPYGIYKDVTIKSAEVREGTSSAGNAWKSLNITFGNNEGIYSHSLFYFDEKDEKNWTRGTMDMPNGGKRELPSTAEELQNAIAAIGFTFFPEDFKKLQQVASKVQSTEQLMDYFKKFIDKNLGKNPTDMKLVGRNSNGRVYATFPKFTGIAQAKDEKRAAENNINVGDWYTWMVSPFGQNLTFSAYEQQKADEYHNAKPTTMDSDKTTDPVNDFDSPSKESEDIDFDSLIKGI